MIGGVCGVWRGLFQPYARKVSRQKKVTEWETTPPDPADPASLYMDDGSSLGHLVAGNPDRVVALGCDCHA